LAPQVYNWPILPNTIVAIRSYLLLFDVLGLYWHQH
jgi:hypothetical protein